MASTTTPTRSPRAARRLQAIPPTIFTEMSALAVRTGALNLGQGFPDVDGPATVVEKAVEALRAGRNQYAPGPGVPELREAIASHQARHYGIDLDPQREVLVTAGATEAIAAAILSLVDPGDEVVLLEPFYDSYTACIEMAGGVRRPVTLRAPDFRLDVDALRAAVTDRTKLLLVNTPHNPTGTVLTREELEAIAAVAVEHDLVVVTDEVYEHLVYDDHEHVPLCTLPGMAERTISISSAGKTFSFTGWKVGWATGPASLVRTVEAAKQWLTFCSGSPLQPAIAHALRSHGIYTRLVYPHWLGKALEGAAERRDGGNGEQLAIVEETPVRERGTRRGRSSRAARALPLHRSPMRTLLVRRPRPHARATALGLPGKAVRQGRER